MSATLIAFGTPAHSGGETRTISLYHVHTGESLTVTYMVDGRYVPSAMAKINYLLRDWRKNKVITIDPKTIDLVWELHADLDSKAPIHIVCGYRTAATNSFLHSIGRHVARESQHILGKAIDVYFPDVPTTRIRNSALVRQIGGVGYYSSGGGPTGFVHLDSGNVRHWGPGMNERQIAQIFRDYRRTIGARLNHADQTMLASAKVPDVERPLDAALAKAAQQPPVEAAYQGGDQQLASLSAQVGAPPAPKPVPRPKLVDVAEAQPQAVETEVMPVTAPAAQAQAFPRPRAKPIEVLMAAAVNMNIEPVSAPPPTAVEKHSPVANQSVGVVVAAESITEPAPVEPTTNKAGKGSLAASLLNGTAKGVPVIRTITTASAAGNDLFSWPQQLIFNGDKAVRRDGAPQMFSNQNAGLLPGSAEAAEVPQGVAPDQATADTGGKGDFQGVNRQGKGNLDMPAGALKLGMIVQY